MEQKRGRKKKKKQHKRKASATKIVTCSGCGVEGHMLAKCPKPNADRIYASIDVPTNWFDEKFDIDLCDEIDAANPAVIGEANTNVSDDDADVVLEQLLKSTLQARNRGKKGKKKKARRIFVIDLCSSDSDE